jgi:hypothetical protein
MSRKLSIARRSLLLSGSFEADILVMLLLRNWNHPRSDDEDFRQNMLESAAEILQASLQGESLFEEISPQNVNLIAALCFAEATSLSADPSIGHKERELRQTWIDTIRRSIPSCFCDPELLF